MVLLCCRLGLSAYVVNVIVSDVIRWIDVFIFADSSYVGISLVDLVLVSIRLHLEAQNDSYVAKKKL